MRSSLQFFLLAMCFWMLKDVPYDSWIKMVLFVIFIIIFVLGAIDFYQGEKQKEIKSSTPSKNKILVLSLFLALTIILAIIQLFHK